MAPLKPIEKDKNSHDKRAQEVLEHATKICDILKKRSQLPSSLPQELDAITKRFFPLPYSSAITQKQEEFESLGCALWNFATNILRQDENDQKAPDKRHVYTRVILSLRVFAFYLLHTAQPTTSKRSKDGERFRRNFKIALKACRFCLDKQKLELAHKVLDTISDHVSASRKDPPLVHISDDTQEDDENRTALRALETEFYLLQMTHAWKIGNFDAAQLHYNRIPVSQLSGSSRLAENAADLCHEAGKSLAKQGLNDAAIAWLERAINALDSCDLEHQSQDAGELRLATTSSLVDCLLRSNEADTKARAEARVEQLAITHGFGNRMAVQLMHFDIVLARSPVRENTLVETALRVANSAVLTDKTFKIIMQTIHRARKVSLHAACEILRQFVTKRLLSNLSQVGNLENIDIDRIEKACITYVHFVTSDSNASHSSIDGIHQTLNVLAQRSGRPISPKSTHAAQTLIWKAAGSSDSEIAHRWCGLLSHPVFDGAGQINKARIGRRAMTMAMAKSEWEAAREAFFQMPPATKNENLTRYVVFKLALHSNDYELALESLNVISKQAKNDPTHLYACVLEAQQSQMRPIAVAALQAVLDKEPSTTHLPTLLRCTTRLLIGELNTAERDQLDEVMIQVVQSFENAASTIAELKKRSGEKWRAEVQWWSKNAYNLALRWCENIDLELLVRLLDASITFIDSHPTDGGMMHQSDLKKRKALCHFLTTTALIGLARTGEEGSESSLQAYLQARHQIDAFDALLPELADDDCNNLKMKSFEVLKFDLECILHLRHWDQLDGVLQACLDFQDVEEWDTLADIVLIIRQNTQELDDIANEKMNKLLDRIINETWQRGKDIEKASRWLRVSFSLDIADSTGEFALKLLHQAAGMAEKALERRNTEVGALYPETELQWLATTAYNKAVDLLSSGRRDEIMRWIDGALELAWCADDNGALHGNLSGRRELLLERLEHGDKQ